MANVSYVNGFSPVETFDGVPYNGKVKPYIVGTGDSTALFIGDLVNIAGGAAVVTIQSDLTGLALPICAQAAATTTTAVGVIVGFEPDRNNLDLLYRVASTQRVVYVCDDPMMILEAQEDGVVTPIALADATKNINIIVAAGSTITGNSGMQLDSSTVATTATFPIRLIRMVPVVNNSNAGSLAFTKWRCMINNGFYKTGILGV
jgi:hypothetical protein